jgi:hypothetical protein
LATDTVSTNKTIFHSIMLIMHNDSFFICNLNILVLQQLILLSTLLTHFY